jgi:hypothetical protein
MEEAARSPTMKRSVKPTMCLILGTFGWPLAAFPCQPASATESAGVPDVPNVVGSPAPLFDSVNENLEPVSMADMIDGRPLVLLVGSCT